jgi:hypothetical protein
MTEHIEWDLDAHELARVINSYDGSWACQYLWQADGTDNQPLLLQRSDGEPALYPGRVHALNGEPESGKSWLALLACFQVCENGGSAIYIDFEDSRHGMRERAVSIGLRPHHRFLYIRPEGASTDADVLYIKAVMTEHTPDIVILDGLAEALVLEGTDENSNSEVTKFMHQLPRNLTQGPGGPAVLMIDHVTKADGGRYARGAGAKLAAVDGAVFTLKAVTPFGRGKTGRSKLMIAKDRPGYLRQHTIANTFGYLTVTEEGTFDLVSPESVGEEVAGLRAQVNWIFLQAMRKLPNQQGTVKEIVAAGGGSQSTVYRMVKEYTADGTLIEVGGGTAKFDPIIYALSATVSLLDPETGDVVS